MTKTVSVSVIIPNWNGAELLEQHLTKVLDATKEAQEIIVVDDASTDASISLLKQKFTTVRVVQKKQHEGFASTVNLGVQKARADIVVLLNTDVVPEKGFLKPLLPHFSDPMVFAVGCEDQSEENGLIVLRGRGEATWKKGFYIHWRGEVDKADTAWVSGGSGAFRRSTWLTLGGMDPLFNPFYWEDIDISYRALKSGYRLVFEPKSRVFHYHEEGKIQKEYSLSEIAQVAYRNQFIFIWKNLSDANLLAQHLFWTPVRLVQRLLQGDTNMIRGFLAALLLITKIIKSRQKSSHLWKRLDRQF